MKECKKVVETVLESFSLLSGWTSTILLHNAYKLSKPKENINEVVPPPQDKKGVKKTESNPMNTEPPEEPPTVEVKPNDNSPTISYQKRIKFNYSSQEKKKLLLSTLHL